MKKALFRQLRFGVSISILFIAAGLLIHDSWKTSHVSTTSQTFASTIQSQPAKQTETTKKELSGKPSRIVIPSVGIDLQVIDGFYNQTSKTWTLTKDKAQYAAMTPVANNQAGNTFIYAHNRKGVFATLPQIQSGATATVYTDNGHKFTYTFRTSLETNPTDDSLFHYQGAPILTLQTCSGLWYQNRQLFTFDLVEAV